MAAPTRVARRLRIARGDCRRASGCAALNPPFGLDPSPSRFVLILLSSHFLQQKENRHLDRITTAPEARRERQHTACQQPTTNGGASPYFCRFRPGAPPFIFAVHSSQNQDPSGVFLSPTQLRWNHSIWHVWLSHPIIWQGSRSQVLETHVVTVRRTSPKLGRWQRQYGVKSSPSPPSSPSPASSSWSSTRFRF